MRVAHLPVYDDNPYQGLLMSAQRNLAIEVINGGGGGNFLRTALFNWKADVIHVHWLHPYMLRPSKFGTAVRASRFLAEIALLKQRGSRIVWTIHNLTNHEGLQPELEAIFTRGFVPLTDACIAHSSLAAEEARKAFHIPEKKIHVIPHGSYIGFYPDTIDRATARSHLGFTDKHFVFLFLGRIQPYKGLFDLIEAFTPLPDHCRLLIAGNPSDPKIAGQLQSAVRKDSRIVAFPDYVADDQLQIYFRAADVSVFPYHRILSSGALILAQSFGKPVIAPRLDGIRESVDAESGWLYEPGKIPALTAALQQALADPVLDKKGAINRRRAEEWPWERVGAEILRLYQNVRGSTAKTS